MANFIELPMSDGRKMTLNTETISCFVQNSEDTGATNVAFSDGEEVILDVEYLKLRQIILINQ